MSVPVMIPPTNGRIVLFTPPANPRLLPDGFVQHDKEQKLPAMVCHVWGMRCVNLIVTDSNGTQFPFSSVTLVQDDDTPDEVNGRYAEWMPFQKGQAAKQASEAARL